MTAYRVAVQLSTVQRKTIHLDVDADGPTSAEAQAAALIRSEFGPGTHNDPPPPLQRIPWRVDKAEATRVEDGQP
jgi:hypothetical protein